MSMTSYGKVAKSDIFRSPLQQLRPGLTMIRVADGPATGTVGMGVGKRHHRLARGGTARVSDGGKVEWDGGIRIDEHRHPARVIPPSSHWHS